jgi:hypothetical protein
LFIALCAPVCGAESSLDMANFREAKEEVLRGFLTLEGGAPSHDTFSRIFYLLGPVQFDDVSRVSWRPSRRRGPAWW